MFYNEFAETLLPGEVVGVPSSLDIQGQVEWGSEQNRVAEDVPESMRERGWTRWPFKVPFNPKHSIKSRAMGV